MVHAWVATKEMNTGTHLNYHQLHRCLDHLHVGIATKSCISIAYSYARVLTLLYADTHARWPTLIENCEVLNTEALR